MAGRPLGKKVVWKLTTTVEQSDRMWKAIPACAWSTSTSIALARALHHGKLERGRVPC